VAGRCRCVVLRSSPYRAKVGSIESTIGQKARRFFPRLGTGQCRAAPLLPIVRPVLRRSRKAGNRLGRHAGAGAQAS
jgi:hypothetical protein